MRLRLYGIFRTPHPTSLYLGTPRSITDFTAAIRILAGRVAQVPPIPMICLLSRSVQFALSYRAQSGSGGHPLFTWEDGASDRLRTHLAPVPRQLLTVGRNQYIREQIETHVVLL